MSGHVYADLPVEAFVETLRLAGKPVILSLNRVDDGLNSSDRFKEYAGHGTADLDARSIGNWEHLNFAYLNVFCASQFVRKLAAAVHEAVGSVNARADYAGVNILAASQVIQSAIVLHLRPEDSHDVTAMALARTALEATGRAALIATGAGDEASKWKRHEQFTAKRCMAALDDVTRARPEVTASVVYAWLCNFTHMNADGVEHFFDWPNPKHEDAYASIAYVSWATAAVAERLVGVPFAHWPILPPHPWA